MKIQKTSDSTRIVLKDEHLQINPTYNVSLSIWLIDLRKEKKKSNLCLFKEGLYYPHTFSHNKNDEWEVNNHFRSDRRSYFDPILLKT